MPLSAPPATPLTDERPVLVAPDSFKGTLRAAVVAAAIGRGLERGGLVPPDLMPLADGGEGTLETLLLALGGETHGATVRGPLGRARQGGLRPARGRGRRHRRDGAGERLWRSSPRPSATRRPHRPTARAS